MTARPIYLDHNATTPVDPRVLDRFVAVERDAPANPASLHAPGRRARAVVEAAREAIAARFGFDPADVVFTSGGTEANNLAVLGLGTQGPGAPDAPVLLGAVEHPSVREAARRRGTVEWGTDATGRAVVRPPAGAVGLVCLVHGQSELGTLQPVAAARELARELGVPLHVDAAQTLGRVPLDDLAGVPSIALSPHKCGGLRGIGVLLVRDAATRLRPLLAGGGQERGLRPGTVSPALASATALAIELALDERVERAAAMREARAAMLDALRASGAEHRCVTPLDASVPNTAMLLLPGLDGRILLPALDLAGIACSQGSACSSGAPTPPAVLLASGLDEATARCCVRTSWGRHDDATIGADAGERIGAIARRLQKKN